MRPIALIVLAAILAVAAGCTNEPVAPGSTDQNGSDADRLQGLWAIESIEVADPKEKMSEDEMEWLRFEFKGDRMTVLRRGQVRERNSFAFSSRVEPRVMQLFELDDAVNESDSNPKEWLYKFEGDELVLAMTLSPGKRPTEFKARKWVEPEPGSFGIPAIIVVRLQKDKVAAIEQARRLKTMPTEK